MKKNKKGGKVIASGGFGCVFSPALKCKNKKKSKNKISKLMIKKNALNEYNEIKDLSSKLNSIPDFKNYFLIYDFDLCEPEKLDEKDLKNYKKKCTALPKKNITEKNINESLSEVLAINMPYGGITVDDFIYDNISYENIIKLNNSLIKLLKHGIIPMNKKNIYHGDIKDSNILVEEIEKDKTKILNTRLIDWGLSTEYKPLVESPFPSVWRNRPLQFNLPFSIILFTDDFINKYTNYLENGGLINTMDLKPFITDYIYYWLKTRGKGHYTFINNIMFILYNEDYKNIKDEKIKTRMIETNITLVLITDYLIEILIHYTHFRENKTLNLRIYLDKVFTQIVDIWGWITNYLPILEIL
jgi:serine/threonine protein kinase